MPHLYTYIYKLYLRIFVPIIPLIIKAPPPNTGTRIISHHTYTTMRVAHE